MAERHASEGGNSPGRRRFVRVVIAAARAATAAHCRVCQSPAAFTAGGDRQADGDELQGRDPMLHYSTVYVSGR